MQIVSIKFYSVLTRNFQDQSQEEQCQFLAKEYAQILVNGLEDLNSINQKVKVFWDFAVLQWYLSHTEPENI